MINEILITIGRILAFIVGGIVILIAILLYLFGKSMCGDDPVGSYISSDNKHTVTYFIRDCGATTFFVDNIDIDGNNIFRAEARYGKSVPFSVKWISNNEVSIETAPEITSIRIFKYVEEYKGVKIYYDEKIKNSCFVGKSEC